MKGNDTGILEDRSAASDSRNTHSTKEGTPHRRASLMTAIYFSRRWDRAQAPTPHPAHQQRIVIGLPFARTCPFASGRRTGCLFKRIDENKPTRSLRFRPRRVGIFFLKRSAEDANRKHRECRLDEQIAAYDAAAPAADRGAARANHLMLPALRVGNGTTQRLHMH